MLRVESWSEYVKRITHPLTQTEIAEKTGIAQTNIGRWMRGARGLPKAEYVVALAREFKQNPVEALVAAGYLRPGEVGVSFKPKSGRTPIKEYSTDELLAEIRHRTL